jgi:intraflagellar transport protein 81
LLRGSKDVIYPVLEYVMPRLPMLRKRAYVARFLLPAEVPPDVLASDVDGSVQDALATLRDLQATTLFDAALTDGSLINGFHAGPV